MQIVIAVLLALLSQFSPVVVSRGDAYAVIKLRNTGDYVCATRYEDDTVGIGIGRDTLCTDPDTTDIDAWRALNCNGQYEEDSDGSYNFYYKCMHFTITMTYISIVSNK